MASITTRTGKGSPLTHVEVDNNFTNLNTAKLEAGAIALGNAGTPSISFTGDANTGIFSNGADQLSITTAGEQRFKVGPNGHVALGAGSTITDFNFLNIQGSNLTHTVGVVLNKTDATAQIWAMRNTGPLTFYNYTANTAALTITTGGLVGIGTSSPSAKLDVEASNFVGAPAIGVRYNASNVRLGFNIGNANAFTYIGSNTNNKLSSDTATYDLTGHFASQLRLDSGQLVFNNAPIGTAGNDITFTNRLTITSAGLVGIGTTNPGRRLVVAGDTNTVCAVQGSNIGTSSVFLGDTDDESIGAFTYNHSSNHLEAKVNGAERLRLTSTGTLNFKGAGTAGSTQAVSFDGSAPVNSMVLDSSGRLLVGTTTALNATSTSTPTFQVIGAAGTSMVSSSSGSNAQPVFTLTNGNGTHTGLIGGGWGLGKISFNGGDGTNCVPSASIEAVVDGTPAGTRIPSALIFSTSTDATPSVLTTRMSIAATGNVNVVGALSKGSGSFRIDHPLSEKKDTHHLIHSFIEGPQADLIYRGQVNLINGKAIINIDEAARMAEGTFNALCTNVCCFTSNESDWTAVRGSVSDNILTIEAQDITSTAEVCWMVIGERKDQHMLDTNWTDENGRVITEPLKEVTPSVTL